MRRTPLSVVEQLAKTSLTPSAADAAEHGTRWETLGYLALGVGMVLFAIEAAVDAQQQGWIERTQVPAVFLTLVGIIALCLRS